MSRIAPGYTAPWWQNDGTSADDVKCHTPDANRYHPPDDRQQGRMATGISMGAVIPRARGDGSSRGFDHDSPIVMIVDPNAPDGGVVFDPRQLTNEKINAAIAAAGGVVGEGRETDMATFSAIARLGKPVKEASLAEMTPDYLLDSITTKTVEPSASNPYLPGGYVAPRSTLDGLPQASPLIQPVKIAGAPQPRKRRIVRAAATAQQVAAPSVEPEARAAAVAPPVQSIASEPDYSQEMAQLEEDENAMPQQPPVEINPQQAMALLSQLVASAVQQQQQQNPPQQQPALTPQQPLPRRNKPPVSAIRRPPAPPLRAPEENDYPEEQGMGQDLAQATGAQPPVNVLGIPFLESAPTKPTKRIVVQSQLGTVAYKFHEIVISDEGLLLVYDTRYEEGGQWVPPDMGTTPLTVAIGPDKKVFNVYSAGIQFNLGCLDMVILLFVPPLEEEPVAETGMPADMDAADDFVVGRRK